MANFFKNAAAGALDFPGDTASLLGLPVALVSDNGLDNSLIQWGENYRQGISDFTGADNESAVREISSVVSPVVAGTAIGALLGGPPGAVSGFLTGVSASATRKGLSKTATRASKMLRKQVTKKDIALHRLKDVPKQTLKNIATVSIPMAGLGMVLPGDSPAQNYWNALALGTLGYKGIRRFKGKKTRTDLERNPLLFGMGRAFDDIVAAEKTIKRTDVRGGSLRQLDAVGADIAEADKALMERSTAQVAETDTLYQRLAGIQKSTEKVPNDVIENELLLGGYNSNIGGRLGSYRKMLEDASTGDVNAQRILGMDAPTARKELINVAKMIDEDYYEAFKQLKDRLDGLNIKKGLNEKSNNELFNEFEAITKKAGRTHFLTPEMKELSSDILKRAYKVGLINGTELKRGLNDISSGLYVPSKSDARTATGTVNRSSNLFKDSRADAIDYETGELLKGIDDYRNSLRNYIDKMNGEILDIVEQERKLAMLDKFTKAYDSAVVSLDRKKKQLRQEGYASLADKFDQLKIVKAERKVISQEDIRKYAKKHNVDQDEAIEKLSEPYLKKGLFPTYEYDKGKRYISFLPRSLNLLFGQKPINNSAIYRLAKQLNKAYTFPIVGKYNLFFSATKRWMYPTNEVIVPLRQELQREGKSADMLGLAAIYAESAIKSMKNAIAKNLLEASEGDSFLGKAARGSRERLLKSLDDLEDTYVQTGMIRSDAVGDIIRTSANTIDVPMTMNNLGKIIRAAKRAYNWSEETSLARTVQILQDAADDVVRRFIIDVGKAKEVEDLNVFVNRVKRGMSNTERYGTGEGIAGGIVKAIQDYAPFGAAMVQGISGKLNYLPPHMLQNIRRYISASYDVHKGNPLTTGLDVMQKLGQVMADLPDNMVFDTLWKTIGVAATICYIWNYGNEENARYYNMLKPYERSNKLQLVNFLGEGVNLSIPIDQEWGVLKNLYDILLEYQFGLGESYDRGNPAFSMRDQLVWSLDQDFGINLPVILEAPLNLTGIESNLEPSAIANGELPFKGIDKKTYRNIDDGLAEAMINSTSKVGQLLVNMAEDRPLTDFRYAIPFLQIDPKMKSTNDTVSFLNQQLKLNPTPELQEWSRRRNSIMAEKAFYERNGCTRSGKILGKQSEVIADYQRQIDDLTRDTYYSIVE